MWHLCKVLDNEVSIIVDPKAKRDCFFVLDSPSLGYAITEMYGHPHAIRDENANGSIAGNSLYDNGFATSGYREVGAQSFKVRHPRFACRQESVHRDHGAFGNVRELRSYAKGMQTLD
jgi:hypothetical protein